MVNCIGIDNEALLFQVETSVQVMWYMIWYFFNPMKCSTSLYMSKWSLCSSCQWCIVLLNDIFKLDLVLMSLHSSCFEALKTSVPLVEVLNILLLKLLDNLMWRKYVEKQILYLDDVMVSHLSSLH